MSYKKNKTMKKMKEILYNAYAYNNNISICVREQEADKFFDARSPVTANYY